MQYALCGDSYVRAFSRRLARERGCRLVVIPKHRRDILAVGGTTKVFDAGPREYLGLIRDAEAVVTDSFHGSVFSILFEREFYSFQRYEDRVQSSTLSRIADLLGRFGLKERLVTRETARDFVLEQIDYSTVREPLRGWIDGSRAFLEDSLGDVARLG